LQASCPSTPGGQYWVTLNYTCGAATTSAVALLPSFYQVRRIHCLNSAMAAADDRSLLVASRH
jgi:hypothetical protein